MLPQDPILQVLLLFPSLPGHAALGVPTGCGCRRHLALTCVQGDVGGVNHLKLQAGEENSPLGKNKRRWGMSRRVAGVRMQLPKPSTPGWFLPVHSSQKLPCRRGSRERADPAPFPAGFGISRDLCRVREGKAPVGRIQAHAASLWDCHNSCDQRPPFLTPVLDKEEFALL